MSERDFLGAPEPDPDIVAQREVVAAFLAAAREGDFEALLRVLDPGVVLRADTGALAAVALREVRGAEAVARQARGFTGMLDVRLALVNGAIGFVATRDGDLFSVGGFTVRGGKVLEIDILADPERLSRLDLTILNRRRHTLDRIPS